MRKDRVLNRIKKGTSKHTLYAKIAEEKQERDNNLSQNKEVNDIMLELYRIHKTDMTNDKKKEYSADKKKEESAEKGKEEETPEQEIVNQMDKLIEVYNKILKPYIDNKALSNQQANEMDAIEKEQKKLIQDFQSVLEVDKKRNTQFDKLKQQEDEKKERQQRLSPEEIQSQDHMLVKSKSEQEMLIIEEQAKLLKTFTLFEPKEDDELQFKKNMIKALEDSIPPKFCYRKLASTKPPICPETHPQQQMVGSTTKYFTGFCEETCDQGQERLQFQYSKLSKFKDYLDRCYEHCDLNKDKKCRYDQLKMIIYPAEHKNWHFQRQFFKDKIPYSSQEAKCKEGEKRWGLYCYEEKQECKDIGYKSCGPAACSLELKNCYQVLSDMVLQTLIGIGTFSLMFLAPGANIILSALTIAKEVSKYTTLIMAMLTSRNEMVRAHENPILKAKVIKKAVKYMKDNDHVKIDKIPDDDKKLEQEVTQEFEKQVEKIKASITYNLFSKNTKESSSKKNEAQTTDLLKGIVSKGGDFIYLQATKDEVKDKMLELNEELDVEGLEVFNILAVRNIITTINSCSKNQGLDCAKGVLGAIALFDPTGIAVIAKAFMYPDCEDN